MGLAKRILIFLLVVGVSLCFFPRVSAQASTDSTEIWVGYFGDTYILLTDVTEAEMENNCYCGEWTYSSIDNGWFTRYNLAYGVTMDSLMAYVGINTSDINIIYFTGTDSYSGEKGNHGLYNLFGVTHYYYPYLAEYWDQQNGVVTNPSVVRGTRYEVPAILAFEQSSTRDSGAFDYDTYKARMSPGQCLRIVFGQTTYDEVSTADSVYWVYRVTVCLKGSPIKTSNWEAKIGSSQAMEDYVTVDSGYAELDELIRSGLQISSDDPSVVQVDANGNLIAVGAGTARINIEYVDGDGSFSEQIVASIAGDDYGDTGGSTEEELNPGDPGGNTGDLNPGGGEEDPDDEELKPPEDTDDPVTDDEADLNPDDEDLNPDNEGTGNGEGGSSGTGGENAGSNGDSGNGNSGNETGTTGPSSGDGSDGNGGSGSGGLTPSPNPGDSNDSGTGGSPGAGDDSGAGDNSDAGDNASGESDSGEGDESEESGNAKGDSSGAAGTTGDSEKEAARIQDAIEAGEGNVPLSEEGEAVYEQVRDYMQEQIEDMEQVPNSARITAFTEDVREYIEELIEQAEEEDEPVDMEEIIEMVEEYIDEMVEEAEEEAAAELSTEEKSEEAESENDKSSAGVYLSVGNINGGDSGGGRSGGVTSSSDNMSTGNTSGGSGGKVLEVEPLPIYYTVLLAVAIAAMFVGGGLYRSLRFRRETAER